MMPDDQDFMSGSVRERMLVAALARPPQERQPWQILPRGALPEETGVSCGSSASRGDTQ